MAVMLRQAYRSTMLWVRGAAGKSVARATHSHFPRWTGTTVGPGGYFLNFTEYGLQINGGHEVMMHLCWLGETNFDYPFSSTDLPTATAIQINGAYFGSLIRLEPQE